jgi:hypothetical protein
MNRKYCMLTEYTKRMKNKKEINIITNRILKRFCTKFVRVREETGLAMYKKI